MSKLIATVKSISHCDSLHILEADFNSHKLIIMTLEVDPTIKVGSKIYFSINPIHIAIAKNYSGDISHNNKINCTIKNITSGKFLNHITLNVKNEVLESIISKDSATTMNLKNDDKITALINANDIIIGKVIQ